MKKAIFNTELAKIIKETEFDAMAQEVVRRKFLEDRLREEKLGFSVKLFSSIELAKVIVKASALKLPVEVLKAKKAGLPDKLEDAAKYDHEVSVNLPKVQNVLEKVCGLPTICGDLVLDYLCDSTEAPRNLMGSEEDSDALYS